MPTLTVREDGGGDFTTLASCLADAGTASGDIILIDGEWSSDDTAKATVVDDNLTIKCIGQAKHPGYWDETQKHWRLVGTSNGMLDDIAGNNTTYDGLAIEQSSATTNFNAMRLTPGAGNSATVRNCLFRCTTNTAGQDCINTGVSTAMGTIAVEQCVMWGAGRAGILCANDFASNNGGTLTVNSCTFWNNGRLASPSSTNQVGGGIVYLTQAAGADGTVTIDCHNCISVENDTGGVGGGVKPADYLSTLKDPASWDVSFSIDSDGSIATETDGGTGNLASHVATDSDILAPGNWVVFEDITTSSDLPDLRLKHHSENDAQDMHTTATAHGLTIPSTDIVGGNRPSTTPPDDGTNYDCGAFEINRLTELSEVRPLVLESGEMQEAGGTLSKGLQSFDNLTAYNSYSSSTSFERLAARWVDNVCWVIAETGPDGGTSRSLRVGTDGGTILIGADGSITIPLASLPTSDPQNEGQLYRAGTTGQELRISLG